MTAPRGSRIIFPALDCGHAVECYSLEPTPLTCLDCLVDQLKTLRKIVHDVESAEPTELLGTMDLEEWLDESGVTHPEMRKDIWRLAQICDAVYDAQQEAERIAHQILNKYESGNG